MKSKKLFTSFLVSLVTMMLCLVSFAGTTLAWFTDTVSNTGNKIQAGTLDVELWQDGSNMTDAQKAAATAVTEEEYTNYYDISNSTVAVFNYDKWEPGYSTPVSFAIVNNGNLTLKYQLSFYITESLTGLQVAAQDGHSIAGDDVFDHLTKCNANSYLEDVLEVYSNGTKVGTLKQVIEDASLLTEASGVLYAKGDTEHPGGWIAALSQLVVKMPETAGNEYENAKITFDIRLLATQKNYEKDGFNNPDYDKFADETPDSKWPASGSSQFKTGKGATVEAGGFTVSVPANAIDEDGTPIADGDVLYLTVKEDEVPEGIIDIDKGNTYLTAEAKIISQNTGKELKAFDYDSPILLEIDVSEVDLQNVYHYSEKMTRDDTWSGLEGLELNHYFYNEETGIITMKVAHLSPFTPEYLYGGGFGTLESPYKLKNNDQLVKAFGNEKHLDGEGKNFALFTNFDERKSYEVTNQDIVLDYNNHSINISTLNGGPITLMNGTIKTAGDGSTAIFVQGTAIFKNMTSNGTVYCEGGSLTIDGGTYNKTIKTLALNSSTISIKDGVFEGRVELDNNTYGAISIEGGKFKLQQTHLKEGYAEYLDDDGYYHVVKKEDLPKYAEFNGVGYGSFDDAYYAWNGQTGSSKTGTIKLLKNAKRSSIDVSASGGSSGVSKELVIDLNGYTLEIEKAGKYSNAIGAGKQSWSSSIYGSSLKVIDTSTEKTGLLFFTCKDKQVDDSRSMIYSSSRGFDLRCEDITIKIDDALTGYTGYLIETPSVSSSQDVYKSNITITNCIFEGLSADKMFKLNQGSKIADTLVITSASKFNSNPTSWKNFDTSKYDISEPDGDGFYTVSPKLN